MYKKILDPRKVVAEKERGFNLTDLLFTLTLSSILLSLALPAYTRLIVKTRLLILTERVIGTVNAARSEAMRRREVVVICPSKDGKTCTGQWLDGWIISVLMETTVAGGSSGRDALLHVYPPLGRNEFLEWHGAGRENYVRLNSDGSARGCNGSFVVYVQALSTKLVWKVNLSATGRIRIDKNPAI